MSTDRDLKTAAEVNLPICKRCGWYAGFTHEERCRPEEGAIADELIAAIPSIPSGKLGYGDGCVVFEIEPDFALVFRDPRPRTRTISFDHIHLLDDLSVAEAAELVRALSDWRAGVLSARIAGKGGG